MGMYSSMRCAIWPEDGPKIIVGTPAVPAL
jgi:hypothetical protein